MEEKDLNNLIKECMGYIGEKKGKYFFSNIDSFAKKYKEISEKNLDASIVEQGKNDRKMYEDFKMLEEEIPKIIVDYKCNTYRPYQAGNVNLEKEELKKEDIDLIDKKISDRKGIGNQLLRRKKNYWWFEFFPQKRTNTPISISIFISPDKITVTIELKEDNTNVYSSALMFTIKDNINGKREIDIPKAENTGYVKEIKAAVNSLKGEYELIMKKHTDLKQKIGEALTTKNK